MAICTILFLATLVGSLLLDATVRPRRRLGWSWPGLVLHLSLLTTLSGFLLAASGSAPVSAILSLALMALFTTVSNAKIAMLGEPLLFSDLALVLAIFRHPRFYLTALRTGQRRGIQIGGPILLFVLAALFVPRWEPHLVGLATMAAGALVLVVFLGGRVPSRLATVPDVDADLVRHGLVATLLLYWHRWRQTPDPSRFAPLPNEVMSNAPDLVIIVQCESFADPTELADEPEYALRGLEAARANAWQWGDLGVSGFGAYTMRTEYGVLFGRSEEELGFRRYDPFLTAHRETSYALSARLSAHGYHCLFVHPHDMRFYGRDKLMPAIGFDRLIGEEGFAAIEPGGHRYVDDRTLGVSMGELIANATGPTLIYAVTMENHGPWDKDQLTGSLGGLGAYLKHLRSSDGMLTDLTDLLRVSGRSALLVFFGDHRPSIPGVSEPGGARHTPYVMLRFSPDGRILTGENSRVDLTPDELHKAILRCVQTGSDRASDPPSYQTERDIPTKRS